MPKKKQARPRLITLLTILLLIQAPILILLGLNLLSERWAFLASWSAFWVEIRAGFSLVIQTPGMFNRREEIFYDVVAFGILILAGVASFVAGLTFSRGKSITWMLSLIAQIGTLLSGIGLFLVHRPSQAYWLILVGVIMVLYLNYGDVRQWFLQPEEGMEEQMHA